MAKRFQVSVAVLNWVLGRPPADGSDEPFLVQEVSEDGQHVWIGVDGVVGSGIKAVQYAAHKVPPENADRALKLREALLAPRDRLPPEIGLIDFSSKGDGELSHFSEWMDGDDFGGDDPFFDPGPPPADPGRPSGPVINRFKQRSRRSR